ncbi:class I SAM-dependent methyltransferase [Frankia sp. AgB32]|uniref:class I SAM-dependent methyltransferase n=1 Tax=Frankia sp. AgB32 TaxID=631119 RepID=UPI00200FEFAC|nr:class I SAM-dependent methyltransferase [Frankia sp. AgB32]MCK9896076.1 class I SAM-dependent methyltransferase [Frankia sp. AgB32]
MTSATDWRAWHRGYADPGSSLSRRLAAVRGELTRVLAARRGRPTRMVSICAGDGRDTLPVLADGYTDVGAVLIELHQGLSDAARSEVVRLGLPDVEVRTADAGRLDSYAGVPPADVFLACGVFGNITDEDLDATVAALPQLLAAEATVLWTRGSRAGEHDPTRYAGDAADLVREVFARHGFVEDAFIRPGDAPFRVGAHRFRGTPRRPQPGTVLFRFTR